MMDGTVPHLPSSDAAALQNGRLSAGPVVPSGHVPERIAPPPQLARSPLPRTPPHPARLLQSQLTQQRRPPPAVVSTYSGSPQPASNHTTGTGYQQPTDPQTNYGESVSTAPPVPGIVNAPQVDHRESAALQAAYHENPVPSSGHGTAPQTDEKLSSVQQAMLSVRARLQQQQAIQQAEPPSPLQQVGQQQQRPSHLQQYQQQDARRRLALHRGRPSAEHQPFLAAQQQIRPCQPQQRPAQQGLVHHQPAGRQSQHQQLQQHQKHQAQQRQQHYQHHTYSQQQHQKQQQNQHHQPQPHQFQQQSQPQQHVQQQQPQQQVQQHQQHSQLQQHLVQKQPQQQAQHQQHLQQQQQHSQPQKQQQPQQMDQQVMDLLEGPLQATVIHHPPMQQHEYALVQDPQLDAVCTEQSQLESAADQHQVFYLVGAERGRGTPPVRRSGGRRPGGVGRGSRVAPPPAQTALPAQQPAAGHNLGMVDLRNVPIEFEDAGTTAAASAAESSQPDLLARACSEAAVDEAVLSPPQPQPQQQPQQQQARYVNVMYTSAAAQQAQPSAHQIAARHPTPPAAADSAFVFAGDGKFVFGQRAEQQQQLAAVPARTSAAGHASPTKRRYSVAEYNELRKRRAAPTAEQLELVFNPGTGRYLAFRQHPQLQLAPQPQQQPTGKLAAAVLDKTLVQAKSTAGAASPTSPVAAAAAEKAPEVYQPRLVAGKLAICANCGTCSSDFNRCDFCRKRLPAAPKVVEAARTLVVSEPAAALSGAAAVTAAAGATAGERSAVPATTAAGGPARGRPAGSAGTPQKRGRPQRRRDQEEPVCLTISSDEEDDASVAGRAPGAAGDRWPEPLLTAAGEPDAADGAAAGDEQLATRGVLGGGKSAAESDADWQRDISGVADGSLLGTYLSERVRAVRVGSYRPPADEPVLFSTRGTRLRLPTAAPPHRQVSLTVPPDRVVQLTAHLGNQLAVLFLYLSPSSGVHVRRLLEMSDPNAAYFDPASQQEMHKRITIIFQDDLSDESRLTLMDVFRSSLGEQRVVEIPLSEANKILVRASPPQLAETIMANTVQTLLQFPPPPASGAIAVTTDDYCCLEEEQFLNDVIIDFYLKYLVQSRLAEADQRRTHVFSSFFYKRLTTRPRSRHGRRPPEEALKVTAAQKRHARVKGWTKNVDIFDMDFLIVPINEHSHWFLAIICFPGQEGYRRLRDDQPCAAPLPRRMRQSRASATSAAANAGRADSASPPAAAVTAAAAARPIQIGSTLITPLPADTTAPVESVDSDSDRDEADADDEDLDAEPDPAADSAAESASDSGDAAADEEPAARQDGCELETAIPVIRLNHVPDEAVKQPCVLIFDSLAGASRQRVVATLRDYLRVEYQVKKGTHRSFSKDTIPGYCAKVPQQNNFSDCGVYVLQYVESFFQTPVEDYHLPLLPMLNWFPTSRARRKREQLARLIERLASRQNPTLSFQLPQIAFHSSPEPRRRPEPEPERPRGGRPARAAALTPRQLQSPSVMKIVRHAGGQRVVVKQIVVQGPGRPASAPSAAAAATAGDARTLLIPASPRAAVSRGAAAKPAPSSGDAPPPPPPPPVAKAMPAALKAPSGALVPRPATGPKPSAASPPSAAANSAPPRPTSAPATPALAAEEPAAMRPQSYAPVPPQSSVERADGPSAAAGEQQPQAAVRPQSYAPVPPQSSVERADGPSAASGEQQPQAAVRQPGPPLAGEQSQGSAAKRPRLAEPTPASADAVAAASQADGAVRSYAPSVTSETDNTMPKTPSVTADVTDARLETPSVRVDVTDARSETPNVTSKTANNEPETSNVDSETVGVRSGTPGATAREIASPKPDGTRTEPSETSAKSSRTESPVLMRASRAQPTTPCRSSARVKRASGGDKRASDTGKAQTDSERPADGGDGADLGRKMTRRRSAAAVAAAGTGTEAAVLVASAGLSAIASGYASSSDTDESGRATPDSPQRTARSRQQPDYAALAGQPRRRQQQQQQHCEAARPEKPARRS